MDQDMRDRIRHLYFVERVPLREIAEALALSAQAVRRALVLPGGPVDRQGPAPMAVAIAAVAPWHPGAPAPKSAAPIRRRLAVRHR